MTPHHHQAQPLLTAAEEIALARRVKAGVDARGEMDAATAARGRTLTAEDEAALARRVRDGLAARNELVERNKGLVMKMAARRATRQAPIADLIQEGTLGLITAADRYDPDKHGTRFCTYASYWVFRGVVQARRAGRLVRLPDATWQLLRRDPAELTVPQRSWVASALCTASVCGLDAASPASRDDGPPDLDEPPLAALDRLPGRHREVMRRRLARETLEATGLALGVGKERVRQIEVEALHLLRVALGMPSVDPRIARRAGRHRQSCKRYRKANRDKLREQHRAMAATPAGQLSGRLRRVRYWLRKKPTDRLREQEAAIVAAIERLREAKR